MRHLPVLKQQECFVYYRTNLLTKIQTEGAIGREVKNPYTFVAIRDFNLAIGHAAENLNAIEIAFARFHVQMSDIRHFSRLFRVVSVSTVSIS